MSGIRDTMKALWRQAMLEGVQPTLWLMAPDQYDRFRAEVTATDPVTFDENDAPTYLGFPIEIDHEHDGAALTDGKANVLRQREVELRQALRGLQVEYEIKARPLINEIREIEMAKPKSFVVKVPGEALDLERKA